MRKRIRGESVGNNQQSKGNELSIVNCRLLTLVVITILWSVSAKGQQNILSSQYLYNGLLINPAYAGSHVQLSATLTYRNQWVNLDGAPTTGTLGVHTSLKRGKVGVGMLITNDHIGSYTNSGAFFSYAYMIKIPQTKGVFSMGVQVGANNFKADFSALNLRSTIDPSFINISEFRPNVGGGIFYYDKKMFAGFSAPDLVSYDKIFNGALDALRTPRYYYLNAGLKLRVNRLSDKIMLHPSFLLRIQDGTPVSMDFNLNLVYDEQISIGSSYRTGDAITTFINLKISEKFYVGYFYDWVTSDLNSYSRGSHELMLNYRTRIRNVHKDLDCPQLFSH